MRRTPVRLSILVCATASLTMLFWASIETTRELTITPIAIDFDEVKIDSETTRQLTIRNPSNGPALIRIAADCSCISLSHSELKVPARSEAAVEVTLNREYGDHRERLYTFLESELEVTAYTDDGVHPQSIPIKAKFFEPYAIDRAACRVNVLATDLPKLPVPYSATTSETGRPVIGKIPPFIESVEVDWHEEFSAGELLITVNPDTPPGLHNGSIEMRLDSPGGTHPQPYLLAFEVLVRAPYRFSPGAVVLGGLMNVESEIVTLEGIPGVRCSIGSTSCDSGFVQAEKHDNTTFSVSRSDAEHQVPEGASVIYIAIDVKYETDGLSLIVQEHFPVYVRVQNQGDSE